MRGKKEPSEAMPPVLALPPAIQKMSEKQASACAAESALVALESLTNSTRALRPTSSMRWASPGKEASPVAVRMVLGEGENNAERRVERRREVDLIRGALDHMRARLVWRGQREDGSADVTADLRVAAGRAQQMRNERGGRRLAVGASD